MGVQGQDDGVAAVQVAAHPLDGVGVDVGGDHLHCGGQVDDDGVVGCGVHDLDDGVADFFGVGQFGAGVGLGGVFPAPVGAGVVLGDFFDQFGGVGGQFFDGFFVFAEDNAALQDRR